MGVIGVLGARGGAGASTVAALLAHALAREGETVLVQVGTGPSMDAVLGTEKVAGLRWPDLREARGEVDPGQLGARLRRWGRCGLLTPDDRQPEPVDAEVEGDVLTALRRRHHWVVVDLDRPGLLSGKPRPAVELCERVVLMVPRDIPAVAGARAVLRQLPDTAEVGVVTRGPAPGGLGGAEIAVALDRGWWGDLPGGRRLARSVDAGVGPVPGARTARWLRRAVRVCAGAG
ncbi:cellulose synthase operon protein YhjQ/BcsQ [Cellulomonas sp. NPDC089187]|uniref:cellulose synthase operon protein YhjQ/BcsQ n=1 Tax=Cellulomonas sp. NPDC089187 TaxID=3154970 RepID=UPI00342553B1